ncbi:magnesium-translocating P-type ATPase [Mycoplasma yeatsii]|uniref:Magnesium-transporting ATPase, P-type 1 n=1 Tax=Mycoplasma yeatsii TaxID=51365 RepID=A0ABU0NEN9_9MOLU|nr:magnesium-translocating P-type ATPase [Mycoplasma yeatsii]MDQ0567496.1 Mg2+-importing ATPase [Mycoplasma yeatsii]
MFKFTTKKYSPRKLKNQKKPAQFRNERFIKNVSSLDQSEILQVMNLTHFGLTNDEYETRLKKYGTNELKRKDYSIFREFMSAFFGPFNIVLILIALYNFISYGTNGFGQDTDNSSSFDLVGGIIIISMVVASGIASFIQSLRSHFVTKRIATIVRSTTNIIRHKYDDELDEYLKITKRNQLDLIKLGEEIDVRQVVPGDLIYLSSGDMLPADVRIIQSNDLFINQSSLTGESMPVEKHAINRYSTNNILDLENICYTGTSVVSGSAIAIVLATGNDTYFSTISKTIMEKRPDSSFTKGIKRVTRLLLIFMLVMVPTVYLTKSIIGIVAAKGTFDTIKDNPWFEAIFFAVAVAVGLTPEMLPMIVTTNLANGASRMTKQKVVVKRLEAIQSLGAIDVLCTDKTGTLTNDKIELIDYLTVDKKADPLLLKYLYINSYYQTGLKNPMDKAIVDYVKKHIHDFSIEDITKIDEIPFDFNRRKLTIIFDDDKDKRTMVTKGSVEEILNSCSKVLQDGKVVNLTEAIKRQIQTYYQKINKQGKRLLGVAYKVIRKNQNRFSADDETNLTFMGFASFLDTPKPSTKQTIKLLNKYGVELKILTGDNEPITRAICKMVDLQIKGLVTGEEIDAASDYELKKIVENNNIFVKLNPLQKVKIIQILKQNDHVVGYMGDGINDAPVLRQSDVAISVNNATDIAKDASDIILLEKSLLVLEKGIIQGRTVFSNILKYIKITTASNFGNSLSVLIGTVWLPFAPMAPAQILLQNLIYDFSQFGVSMDNVDASFLKTPQRWNSKDLLPFTIINGSVSSIFDLITFAITGYALGFVTGYNNAVANNTGDANMYMAQFQACWFLIGLLSQTLVFQVLRTEHLTIVKSRSSWPIYTIAGLVTAIAIFITFVEQSNLGSLIQLKTPGWVFLPIAVAILSGYFIVAELTKMGYKKVFNKWL